MYFPQKARLVAYGNTTTNPKGSTYVHVLSRETITIALNYAASMGLDIIATGIQNAYITVLTTNKFYIICGIEFGSENIVKKSIVK